MTSPLIEVYVNDAGDVEYRMRTSLLTTRDYGCIIADILNHAATMMSNEGGFDREEVLQQTLAHFLIAMKQDQGVHSHPEQRTIQ